MDDAVTVAQGVRMTTGEAVVAGLAANGLDTIFCLPGVQNDAPMPIPWRWTASARPRSAWAATRRACCAR